MISHFCGASYMSKVTDNVCKLELIINNLFVGMRVRLCHQTLQTKLEQEPLDSRVIGILLFLRDFGFLDVKMGQSVKMGGGTMVELYTGERKKLMDIGTWYVVEREILVVLTSVVGFILWNMVCRW